MGFFDLKIFLVVILMVWTGRRGASRRQSPGEIAAAATSHSLPSLGSAHALAGDARPFPMQKAPLGSVSLGPEMKY